MVRFLVSLGRRYVGPAVVCGFSAFFLAITLLHVYLLTVLGIRLDQFLTFWLPLMAAAFLILFAAFWSEDTWVLILILGLAATLQLIIPVGLIPAPPIGDDAIYGYSLVVRTLTTGSWQFGVGAGYAGYTYSYYPMLFIFAASWAGVASLPPYLITNYAFPAVSLTLFLTFRMFLTQIGLSKRSVNLALFALAMIPSIHTVDGSFHYEAYAMIFLSIVLLYSLKPKISASERVVAVISILAIMLSHYYTAYLLAADLVILAAARLTIRGTRMNLDLVLLAICAAIAWNTTTALHDLQFQVSLMRKILATSMVTNLINEMHQGKLLGPSIGPTRAFYPASWFIQLATMKNVTVVVLSFLAIFALCVRLPRRIFSRVKARKNDILTYLGILCFVSLFISYAAYYGLSGQQMLLGSVTATSRFVEIAYVPSAIFTGLGLTVLLQRMALRGRKRLMAGMMLCALIVLLFTTSVLVQGYDRSTYDSSYTPIFYDEYSSRFQEPFYLGSWWSNAGNRTLTIPFAGSNALDAFVRGYGQQPWWASSLDSPFVQMNSTLRAYYALDLAQISKPDHVNQQTLKPEIVSSQNPKVNVIFTTGRLVLLSKT